MKKLSPKQIERFRELQEETQNLRDDLESAILIYNTKVNELFDEIVRRPMEQAEGLEEDVNNFLGSIYSEMEQYFNDKSEDWKNSEKGLDYQHWMDLWNQQYSVDVSELEVVEIDGCDIPELDDAYYPHRPEE